MKNTRKKSTYNKSSHKKKKIFRKRSTQKRMNKRKSQRKNKRKSQKGGWWGKKCNEDKECKGKRICYKDLEDVHHKKKGTCIKGCETDNDCGIGGRVKWIICHKEPGEKQFPGKCMKKSTSSRKYRYYQKPAVIQKDYKSVSFEKKEQEGVVSQLIFREPPEDLTGNAQVFMPIKHYEIIEKMPHWYEYTRENMKGSQWNLDNYIYRDSEGWHWQRPGKGLLSCPYPELSSNMFPPKSNEWIKPDPPPTPEPEMQQEKEQEKGKPENSEPPKTSELPKIDMPDDVLRQIIFSLKGIEIHTPLNQLTLSPNKKYKCRGLPQYVSAVYNYLVAWGKIEIDQILKDDRAIKMLQIFEDNGPIEVYYFDENNLSGFQEDKTNTLIKELGIEDMKNASGVYMPIYKEEGECKIDQVYTLDNDENPYNITHIPGGIKKSDGTNPPIWFQLPKQNKFILNKWRATDCYFISDADEQGRCKWGDYFITMKYYDNKYPNEYELITDINEAIENLELKNFEFCLEKKKFLFKNDENILTEIDGIINSGSKNVTNFIYNMLLYCLYLKKLEVGYLNKNKIYSQLQKIKKIRKESFKPEKSYWVKELNYLRSIPLKLKDTHSGGSISKDKGFTGGFGSNENNENNENNELIVGFDNEQVKKESVAISKDQLIEDIKNKLEIGATVEELKNKIEQNPPNPDSLEDISIKKYWILCKTIPPINVSDNIEYKIIGHTLYLNQANPGDTSDWKYGSPKEILDIKDLNNDELKTAMKSFFKKDDEYKKKHFPPPKVYNIDQSNILQIFEQAFPTSDKPFSMLDI